MRARALGFAVCAILVALTLGLHGCIRLQHERVEDISEYDFRDGDILLQHIECRLGTVITGVTDSQYSHCGMVVTVKDRLCVLEAVGPVRYTPIRQWLGRGFRAWFTQLRVRDLSKERIAEAIAEARACLGRPYDIQYELDDEKLYCSELVYKAYLRGAVVEVGCKQKLGSLNWRPHEEFIRRLADGELPLDRQLITPESLARSRNVQLVYTNFPPREDAPLYDTDTLEGKWQGEYTVRNLDPARVTLDIGPAVQLKKGLLRMKDGKTVKIVSLKVEPFTNTRRFSGTLADSRNITAGFDAQIRDTGTRVVGTWSDDRGHSGIFSLEKPKATEQKRPQRGR